MSEDSDNTQQDTEFPGLHAAVHDIYQGVQRLCAPTNEEYAQGYFSPFQSAAGPD